MSKEVSKTKVGAFVLGGLALLMTAIISLGGKNLFADDINYVLYFDGSVSGLSIGAPVVFRGVPLGKVTQILLVANSKDEGVTIPVLITIDADSIRFADPTARAQISREELMRRMVQRGLRARLHLQSIVTGQYNVELDFFPETPARFHSTDHSKEIPTAPSTLDEFQRTFSSLPLESMANSLNKALDGIAAITTNKELHEAIGHINSTFKNTAELTESAASLRNDLQRMLNSIGDASVTLDNQLPEAMIAFQLAMNGFAAVAKQLDAVLVSANSVISPQSRTLRSLQQTLTEVTKMAESVKDLAELLERQPEALLRGKGAN